MDIRRAVLWDFDGVLFPTERLRDQTHQEVVKRFGGQIPSNFYKEIEGTGRAHEEVRAQFIQASGIEVSPGSYTRLFQKILRTELTNLVPLPGVRKLVSALQGQNYLMAVVSASPRSEVPPTLVRTGLSPFFGAVVCGDDIARKKPAPDGYLRALCDLSVEPANAVAIEDSCSGIEAARAADLRVIALRHDYNYDHDFAGANLVIDSFIRSALFLQIYLELAT